MSVHEERETPARTLQCADGAGDSNKPRDSNILAKRMREHFQDKQVSNRATLGLEEMGGVWKGMTRKRY